MAEAPAELLVITRTYDLVLWTSRHVAQFSRAHRHTLGVRLENQLYQILEMLLRAKFTRDRTDMLRGVNLELEILRFQFRLAKDLRCMSLDSYGFASRSLVEIGKMVGGWLRHAGGGKERANE
jgi:hypothetical protein